MKVSTYNILTICCYNAEYSITILFSIFINLSIKLKCLKVLYNSRHTWEKNLLVVKSFVPHLGTNY